MSYEKAMKHARNPRKYKKTQPIIFHTESFNGCKSIYRQEEKCPNCGYYRPLVFIKNGSCDLCRSSQKSAFTSAADVLELMRQQGAEHYKKFNTAVLFDDFAKDGSSEYHYSRDIIIKTRAYHWTISQKHKKGTRMSFTNPRIVLVGPNGLLVEMPLNHEGLKPRHVKRIAAAIYEHEKKYIVNTPEQLKLF